MSFVPSGAFQCYTVLNSSLAKMLAKHIARLQNDLLCHKLRKTIAVNSTADSGSGTLRQALLDAQAGDMITFGPAVFPPRAPATIYLTSSLPLISQGNLKINASNAELNPLRQPTIRRYPISNSIC